MEKAWTLVVVYHRYLCLVLIDVLEVTAAGPCSLLVLTLEEIRDLALAGGDMMGGGLGGPTRGTTGRLTLL